MKILLTNDDSHSSPFLAFIIEKLKSFGELKIIVPKHEQSWKGKSMTRFSHLRIEEIEIYGAPAYTLDGTPADCANVGVYHLFEGKPDVVISGINAGLNAGISFILSSGTVGACLEANIAGVPAIALSQAFDRETRNAYLVNYTLSDEVVEYFRLQTKPLLDRVLDPLLLQPSKSPITWNVNLPFAVTKESKIVVCPVAHAMYGRLYKKVDDHFEHNLVDTFGDSRKECDSNLLVDGNVTITPLDIRRFGELGTHDCTLGATLFGNAALLA